jgi:hypothetical protein
MHEASTEARGSIRQRRLLNASPRLPGSPVRSAPRAGASGPTAAARRGMQRVDELLVLERLPFQQGQNQPIQGSSVLRDEVRRGLLRSVSTA